MPVLTTHLDVVLIKVETTEGTDAVPAATDAIQLIAPARLTMGAEQLNDRPDLQNQLLEGAQPLSPAGKYFEVTGRIQLRGLGSAYSGVAVPEVHALLQGAGLSATFNTNKWDYDTASTGLKTLTVYGFKGADTGVWVKYVLTAGRVSRLALRCPAGQPGEVEFVIRGIFNQPTDASVTTPTYQTDTPPLVTAAGTWALGALSAAIIRDFSATIENTLVPRLSGNATDALLAYATVNRKLTFDARFEAARIADYDVFTQWKTAAANALAIVVGASTTHRFKLNADKATILEAPTFEDDRGLQLYRVAGVCTPEGTNRFHYIFD